MEGIYGWEGKRTVRYTVAGRKRGWSRNGKKRDFVAMKLELSSLLLLLFSDSAVSNSLWHHGLQHARLSCPSPCPGACSNSHPLSQWFYPTISSSVVPFFSCLQSFPASGPFLMNRFFTSGGQSFGVSASASVLPVNIQDWFSLEWTGLISLQSKGLKSLLQYHSSKTSVLQHSTFFMVVILDKPKCNF